ncbi:MAG: hypothetical protein ACKPKO_26300 [Candidatus Fonsibacter sp.]
MRSTLEPPALRTSTAAPDQPVSDLLGLVVEAHWPRFPLSDDASDALGVRLRAFYEVFNKELVSQAARLVACYQGDADFINQKLREKYGL